MSQNQTNSTLTPGIVGGVAEAEALGPSAVAQTPTILAPILPADFHRDALAKPVRRTFTRGQIQEILSAVEDAPRGQSGTVLRSYGVYSSQVAQWKQKYQGTPVAKNKTIKQSDSLSAEEKDRRIAELERENRHLGLIIDALKKVSALAKVRVGASKKDTGK